MIKVIEKSKIKLKPIILQLNDPDSARILTESFDYLPYILLTKLETTTELDTDIETNIDTKDIIYVKLHNSKFLPEIELYCDDSKGVIFNDIYPYDRDVLISIFIKSNTNEFSENQEGNPIRMDFRLIEHEIVKSNVERDRIKHLIKGILNVDDLHYSYYESNNETSYNVLKSIAQKMNLGFASNVTNSNDKMIWINPNETYLNYIRHITEHSYISEDSFIWTFIDFYYNINYVDIQTELNEFDKSKKDKQTNPQIIKDPDEIESVLYLTNNKVTKGTNRYISKFNLINQSYKVNLEKAYKMKTTWYDNDLNSIFKTTLKELESDDSRLSSDEGSLNQLTDKDSKIYTENINDEFFMGKVDIDNVHEKYLFAKSSNKYNYDKIVKMKMIITLNKMNFFIKRFQNIRIEIYNQDDFFSKDAKIKSPGSNINKKLSGYWYVTGINYLYKKTGGHEQEVTLVRRDLNIDYGKQTEAKDVKIDSNKPEKTGTIIPNKIGNEISKKTSTELARKIISMGKLENIPANIQSQIDSGLITPDTVNSLEEWLQENPLRMESHDSTPFQINQK